MPKVSVIIPVYKAEVFIEKCCRTLFNQTLEDIEYVFVNDCSPDDSIQIIQRTLSEFPHRNSQVKIYSNPENLGVKKTREKGIALATGEYLIHCDSDDWIDLNMYETMYHTAKKDNADLVICGYTIEYRNKQTKVDYPVPFEKNDNLNIELSPIYGSLCNKLAKRSMIKEKNIHFFDDINMGEDLGYATQLRFYSQNTKILKNCFYHYNQLNPNSIFTTFNKTKNDDIVKCAAEIEKLYKKNNEYSKNVKQINYLKFQSKQYLLLDKSIRNFEEWKSIYPESNTNILNYNNYPKNLRIISWLVNKNFFFLARFLLYIKDNLK